MQVIVQLTHTELAEMETGQYQIKDAVIRALDRGLDVEGVGKVYLASFNVDVQVVD